MRDRDLLVELFEGYANAEGVDLLLLCWWAGAGDEAWSRTLLEPFADVAERASIPLVVSPVEATAVGDWTRPLQERGVSFARGLRSAYRAARALDRMAQSAPSTRPPIARRGAPTEPPPLVATAAGAIVPFAEAMELLRSAGIVVAPFVVLAAPHDDDPAITALGEHVVVKLADVPHRTELDAVRVGVARGDVPLVARELRAIARAQGAPEDVAVQAMISGIGEAFVGLHARTDLGPIVLFGVGGVLVELTGSVDGAMLPLTPRAADRLVERVAGDAVFTRIRGQTPWDAAPLADAIEAVGRLWERHGSWLASADLNPLVVTADGAVAVDALLVADAPPG
jgi:acyl-CoA synthetase (NDP forming)